MKSMEQEENIIKKLEQFRNDKINVNIVMKRGEYDEYKNAVIQGIRTKLPPDDGKYEIRVGIHNVWEIEDSGKVNTITPKGNLNTWINVDDIQQIIYEK